MIPEYKTILYATDLSHNSIHVFRHAISLARFYDATIHLLHVLPEIDQAMLNIVSSVMGREQLDSYDEAGKNEIAAEIRQKLERFTEEELRDHPEDQHRLKEIELHHGHPTAEILKAADRIDADLVVMGSHGKGHLQYAFLGSVAEKVLRKSLRPTMVIPLGPKKHQ